MNHTVIRAAAAVMAAAGLAACSTHADVQGAPTTATSAPSSATPAADGVNTALLKPGNYPTAPQPVPPWSLEGAIRMQAQQMGDFLVGPWEVDPALTGMAGTQVITDPADLKRVLLESGTVPAAHHFINAFATTRLDPDNPDAKRLVTMVMRFPTPEDADAAAKETSAALGSYLKAGAQETAFIPGHPETQSTQSPQVGGKYQVTGLTAHGPFVLYQEAMSTENAEAAAAMVGKTLDLQIPRIDGYHPSDPAAKQSLDPTNLVANTIGNANSGRVGVYGSYGALHFSAAPVKTAQRYTAAGVDFQADGKTTVIQAKDPAAATTLALSIFDANSAGQQPGPTVPGLPAAKCLQAPDGSKAVRYRCIAPMGRWVVLAAAQQAPDITQQVASQYLMLVGK